MWQPCHLNQLLFCTWLKRQTESHCSHGQCLVFHPWFYFCVPPPFPRRWMDHGTNMCLSALDSWSMLLLSFSLWVPACTRNWFAPLWLTCCLLFSSWHCMLSLACTFFWSLIITVCVYYSGCRFIGSSVTWGSTFLGPFPPGAGLCQQQCIQMLPVNWAKDFALYWTKAH